MNISVIIEVIASLYDLILSDDASIPQVARDALKVPAQPQLSQLADYTQIVSGRKLICYFGEEESTLAAANALVAAFSSPVDAVILCSHFKDGKKYGERVTDIDGNVTVPAPIHPITHATLFKYANQELVDEVPTDYLVYWNSLTAERKAVTDPFMKIAGFKPRDLT